MSAVQTIAFDVRPWREDATVVAVVPMIDDVALTDLIDDFERRAGMEPRDDAYGGLIPAFYRFGAAAEHFLGVPPGREAGRVPLLGCECGEWGCWPLTADVHATVDEVVWANFGQPHRVDRDYSGFGPFRFGRADYEDALAELAPIWDAVAAE